MVVELTELTVAFFFFSLKEGPSSSPSLKSIAWCLGGPVGLGSSFVSGHAPGPGIDGVLHWAEQEVCFSLCLFFSLFLMNK